MTDDDRSHMLVRLAEMYYEQELSQREISEQLSLSRPMVSRMLAEARTRGIVTIHIHRPIARRVDLGHALQERYGVGEAVVVPVPDNASGRRVVGVATAHYLRTRIANDMVVGLSWGRDLYEVIHAFTAGPLEGVQVVQLAGGLGEGDPTSDGPNIAREFAEKVRGTVRYLFAPTVVATRETRAALAAQPQIAQTFELAKRRDQAVTGIGALEDEASTLARAGYLSAEERASLIASGGVAHVLGYVISADGELVAHPYNARVVAAPLEDVRRAPLSVGVAATPEKAAAAAAALHGGLFDVLIVSEAVANRLLAFDRKGVVGR